MPFKIPGTRGAGLAAIAAGSVALALSAPAQALDVSNPTACTPQATVSQPFTAWGDGDFYTPVVNNGFEQGTSGWLVSPDAGVVADNEPWQVGGAGDSRALDLPSGATAVSSPMCIDASYADFRLFAKSLASGKGQLKIDVLYLDRKGNVKSDKPFTYTTSSTSWQPTDPIGIDVFSDDTTVDAAPVAFRFTAQRGSHFEIDDVFVDPMNRR